MRPSGANRSRRGAAPRTWSARGAALVATLSLTGCLYSFSGGGGLPRNLRTVAVQPFDNQTASSEIQREVFDEVRKAMRERLNLREAPEARAHVLVRGTITRYDVDLAAGVSADPRQTTSTRRRLQITVTIEVIDQTTQKELYKQAAATAEGQYPEGGEESGRRQAVETLVSKIIEGMQSQW